MPEPATQALSTQFHGRAFTRSRLRDRVGPSHALYHLFEMLAFRSVTSFKDEFDGVLNTDKWTASNSGGAGVANFARLADTLNGVIQGNPGTADDADVRLFTTSNEIWRSGNRCAVVGILRSPAAVAGSKFEFGFADGVGAGAVNVKATPTSTATDYAVAVRDTDDDALVSLIADGTTDAVASADGSLTFVTNTYYHYMIALNERRECRLWIDSNLQATVRRGPDATTALGLWAYAQNRAATANKTLDIDLVFAWQERAAI